MQPAAQPQQDNSLPGVEEEYKRPSTVTEAAKMHLAVPCGVQSMCVRTEQRAARMLIVFLSHGADVVFCSGRK